MLNMKYTLTVSCNGNKATFDLAKETVKIEGDLSTIEEALASDSNRYWKDTSDLAAKALKMLANFQRE